MALLQFVDICGDMVEGLRQLREMRREADLLLIPQVAIEQPWLITPHLKIFSAPPPKKHGLVYLVEASMMGICLVEVLA